MVAEKVDPMEVKDAVRLAKAHVRDMFDDEQISEIGLEEVDFDDAAGVWKVTIGFRRPWSRRVERRSPLPMFAPYDYADRWYKQVLIGQDGRLLSIRDRELKEAA